MGKRHTYSALPIHLLVIVKEGEGVVDVGSDTKEMSDVLWGENGVIRASITICGHSYGYLRNAGLISGMGGRDRKSRSNCPKTAVPKSPLLNKVM